MAATILDRIEDLPAALRFVRAARALSLRDVAEATGVSASELNRIERGESDPKTHTLRALVTFIAGPSA